MQSRIIFFFILITFSCHGQEIFKNRYRVKNFIDFQIDNINQYEYLDVLKNNIDVVFLSKEEFKEYKYLPKNYRDSIDLKLKFITLGMLKSAEFFHKDQYKIKIDKAMATANPNINQSLGMTAVVRASTFDECDSKGNCQPSESNEKTYEAWVLFEKDRLFVNLWPFKRERLKAGKSEKSTIQYQPLDDIKDDKTVLFYELKDDQTVKLKFKEWYMSAITIPIKYRFDGTFDGVDDDGNAMEREFDEEFTSSFNIALFGGHTWGRTNFQHRKKVGNRTFTYKNSLGAFLGSSVQQINEKNTDDSSGAPTGEEERSIGLISMGIGFVKSWNKIAIGVFSGIDVGVGDDANSWVHNGRPWIGIGFGYDLFKI